jgi:catechol 2,3-dioxygenase-like lactoylglutathione lyase family enzyme
MAGITPGPEVGISNSGPEGRSATRRRFPSTAARQNRFHRADGASKVLRRDGCVAECTLIFENGTQIWEVIVMRGLVLFGAGTLVGLAITAFAQSQTPNRGIVGLNHVGLSVPDLDKAVEYYTKTMGFPEAFRIKNASGQVQLVYVQISQNTFVELQPANAQRPPGITHFGLHVENMGAATAMFRARGAAVGETTLSGTKAILSNIVDPNGIRMELAELPPESLHRQAMERWR